MAASKTAEPKPRFFRTPALWRTWLRTNRATAEHLWVGFYKRDSGKPSITWPQSVDEALCYGWIDGVRKNVDAESYKIRFTRRKKGSVWSSVNVRRVTALRDAGRMRAAGEAAFEQRKANRSGIYSYEQRPAELPRPWLAKLKKNKAAWTFFAAQPPWYRRTATWWVISAKQDQTRERRFAQLRDDSAAGLRIGPLRQAREE